jgi:hypothetical protein
MTKVAIWVTAAAMFGAAPAWAHGKKHHRNAIEMNDAPTAVQMTLRQEAGGGTIEELHKEKRDGQVLYEAEVVKDGKGTDVKVDVNGKVVDRGPTHDEAAERAEHHKK